MQNTIKDKDSLWEFSHRGGRCGGPHSLAVGGSPLLSMFDCSVNGISDSDLRAQSSRLYHKAGLSVFESKGAYPFGVAVDQICRYAGNAVRVTWDVKWPKETRPTKPVQIGSAGLVGKWTKLTTISREGSVESFDLQNGLLPIDGKPISMVLEREDGVKFEYSLGFDLWRWDAAMGQPVATPLSIEVADDHTSIIHNICDPTPEEVYPEGREYRFMAVIAFSAPNLPKAPAAKEAIDVPFRHNKEDLNLDGITSNSLRINYNDMPCIENGRRLSDDGRHGICFEDAHSLTAAKRTIRQIASYAQSGTLVLDGLTPGVCIDGSHCAKKQPRVHCDLYSIVAFLAWAKNCLGDGWTITAPQPSPWNLLPSLEFSHLPLDFNY
ncbi:MAG: hypothetical protein J5833_05570 [Victivallales bacterium]|nr:hypothetical protein [Victivallales bacterium]